MDLNPQIIFERARRLYTETIPELIERERQTGKGWDGAAGHIATLGMIGAITDEESTGAWKRLTAAMQEHLRGNLFPNSEGRDNSVESGDIPANEDHAVPISGRSQNHLDSRISSLACTDFNSVNAAGKTSGIKVGAKQAYAVIPRGFNHVGSEVSDDHRDSEPFCSSTSSHNGQLNAVDGRQTDAADLHNSSLKVIWPGDGDITKPIDWSPLAGRAAILHPENSQDKPAANTQIISESAPTPGL